MAINSLLAPIGSAFCDGMPYDEIWCRVLFQDADVKREFGLLPMAMLPLQDSARMAKWLKDISHRTGADALRLMRAYAHSLKQRPPIEEIDSDE